MVSAINALRKLQERDDPQFRFVVHRGETLIGGMASMGEESLSGPAVNFVFRIEKVAGTMGRLCLLSEAAAQEMKTLATLQPLPGPVRRRGERTRRPRGFRSRSLR